MTLAGRAPRRGKALADLALVEKGALLIRGGRILAVGPQKRVERLAEAKRARKMDLGRRVVLPGFVDSHTHLVFAGNRAAEYEQRIAGATYEEIAKKGGGILSTVRKVRETTATKLEARARGWLTHFAAHGTTTLEAKSGYGLDIEAELTILRVLRDLGKQQPIEIVRTLLAAHVVPPEYDGDADSYVDHIVRLILPAAVLENLVEFCDVYVDRGAFSVNQARRILAAARACGLTPRLHAEQIAHTGAARLAIEVEAASADHLDQVTPADIRALAESDVCCTMLPGCCFHLGVHPHAPARKLIEAGAVVALATDFNPGTSPTVSMSMVLSLACTQMRMSPAEAVAAATINGAYALRRQDEIGSLEVGKFADLAVFDVADYREIPYYFGVNMCWLTMKRGAVIFSKERI